MKFLKPTKKWILIFVGLLLVLFTWRAVLFFTAKPKITVDYVAEYNRTSIPQNYAPEENAVPYYQKAFDVFIEPTEEIQRIYCFLNLHFLSFRSSWPTDLNDTEQVLLEKWLASNTLAFEYFIEASNKPYYWIQRKSEDNSIDGITFPELGSFRELSQALIWDAKFKAVKGEFQQAFENILTCYKAGKHKCRPNLLVSEQRSGLGIERSTLMDAFIILNKTKVPSGDLKFLQDALQKEFDNVRYVPSLQTEKFLLYDNLQRSFIDNGKGTGKRAWRNPNDEGIPESPPLILKLFACLISPTRNEMGKLIDVYELRDKMMAKTPWEISVPAEWSNYYKEIQKIWNREKMSIGMRLFCRIAPTICKPSPKNLPLFHLYHETKAKTEALITVLSILRFKNDYNRLPETLEELVSTGYLQSLPMDPYSNRPLVYKLPEDNFILYSVGKDFIDDGGVFKRWVGPGFGPMKETTSDIIYWPVESLDKTQYEEIQERMYERAREFSPPPVSRE